MARTILVIYFFILEVKKEAKPQEMVTMVEIKAGELNLNAPYTTEGLRAVRAMVTFLEAELMEEEEIKSKGEVSPILIKSGRERNEYKQSYGYEQSSRVYERL